MKGDTSGLFLTDGRFHFEAEMISNPYLRPLHYDQYVNTLMDEQCDTKVMKMICRGGIEMVDSPNSIYLYLYSSTWADR